MLYLHFFINISLEYTIREFQENQAQLEPNGLRHILVYANDINLVGKNINTIKKAQILDN
jgi:hypothetical protein